MEFTAQRERILGPIGLAWLGVTIAVIVYATRLGLFLSPTDAAQGNVGRIFFYHVPTSMLSLVFPYINFAASIAFLFWRTRDPLKALTADAWAVSSGEVTVVYASICLLTGMLWGKVAWGIWWTWDARLTSMLVLWLIYVSYLMLRKLSSAGQFQTLAAALSIFAAIDVPLVYLSIHFLRTQHPAPVFFGGPDSGLDKSMYPAWIWNIVAWGMWGLFLLGFRYLLERRRQDDEQDAILRSIDPWSTTESAR